MGINLGKFFTSLGSEIAKLWTKAATDYKPVVESAIKAIIVEHYGDNALTEEANKLIDELIDVCTPESPSSFAAVAATPAPAPVPTVPLAPVAPPVPVAPENSIVPVTAQATIGSPAGTTPAVVHNGGNPVQ